MNEFFYPSLMIIAGVLVSTIALILLTRLSKQVLKLFDLYPESRGILKTSLKFISWFSALLIFLWFLSISLRQLGFEFTTNILESIIKVSPNYIVAILIILCGVYVSRIVKERSKDYHFEFKDRILLVIEFIIQMTFIFTALYSIGVNIAIFLEFYKVIMWSIGLILALIVSMTIGIPLGISIYDKMQKENKRKK